MLRRRFSIALALSLLPACSEGGEPSEQAGETTAVAGSESTGEAVTTGSGSTDGAQTSTTGVDPEFVCGNGRVEGIESCDDGTNDGAYGGCLPDCSGAAPFCGDGHVDADHETCDAGAGSPSLACNATCRVPGELLVTLSEPSGTSSSVAGIKATTWQGRPTVFFGGWGPSVWELDPAAMATARIRTIPGYFEPHGVVALDAELLVAGYDGGARARRYDDDLGEVWTYAELTDNYPQVFVGAARIDGGAVLGADPYGDGGYWAIGISDGGATLWESLTVIPDADAIYARDLRGVGGGRAALLSSAQGPDVRIFDSGGELVGAVAQPALSDGYFTQLCVGEGSFYIHDVYAATLVGFDADGTPTNSVGYRPSQSYAVGAACSVRDDGSPLVVQIETQDGVGRLSWFTHANYEPFAEFTVGGDGVIVYDEAVEVYLDEERGRAWAFVVATDSDHNSRILIAAVVAI